MKVAQKKIAVERFCNKRESIVARHGAMVIVFRQSDTGQQITLLRSFENNDRKTVVGWGRPTKLFRVAAFSPDGQTCVIVCGDRVTLLDLSDDDQSGFNRPGTDFELVDRAATVTAVCMMEDGMIVIGDESGKLSFHGQDGYEVKSFPNLPTEGSPAIRKIAEVVGGVVVQCEADTVYVRIAE